MTICAIKICRNYKGRSKTTKKVTYHRFPTDQNLRSQWIDIIRKSRGEELWQPTKNTLVCSDHFHRKDKYFVNKQERLRLKKGAVPRKALFLSSLQSDGSDDSDEEADTRGCDDSDEEADTRGCDDSDEKAHTRGCEEKAYKDTEPTVIVEAGPSSVVRDAQNPCLIELDPLEATNITRHDEDVKTTLNETENEQDFSDLDSVYDSPGKAKLKRELRRKITLQKKHTLKIQSLRRKNIRLKKKILTLKQIITNLKKERYIDNDTH